MKKPSLSLLLAITMACFAFTGCTSNDAQLKKMVDEANRTIYPKMVDEGTRLDSLSVSPGAIVNSHYTLISFYKDDFTPEQLQMLTFELKVSLLKSIIVGDKQAKRLRNAGVTFWHQYKDLDGELVVEVIVTPEDYKAAMKSK